MARSVENLSDAELREIVQKRKADAQSIRGIFKESITFATYERERLEAGFADFAQRGGALMAVAGLIALLPFPELYDVSIARHFFVLVYPFLGAAVIAFFLGSLRMHIKMGNPLIAAEGARDELIILRNESAALFRILEKLKLMYEKALKAHRFTTISVVLYLLAFIFHYGWLLVTQSAPNFPISLGVSIALLFIGWEIYLRLYNKTYTESWKAGESEVEHEIMLGGIAPPKQQTPPKES